MLTEVVAACLVACAVAVREHGDNGHSVVPTPHVGVAKRIGFHLRGGDGERSKREVRKFAANRSSLVQVMNTSAEASPTKEPELKEPKLKEPELDCEKLSSFIYCDPAPVKMGFGTFSQSYLVKDRKTGKLEVLKTFFMPKKEDEPRTFATVANLLKPSNVLKKNIDAATMECDFTQEVHREDTQEEEEGAKYVMRCVEANAGWEQEYLEGQDPEMPLFSLVSYCGAEDLHSFMARIVQQQRNSSVNIFRQTFKQLLLGVNLLATGFEEVFVHHDLKPENIMVKSTKGPDGKWHHRAHIIDFGASGYGDEDVCRPSGSTREYAPAEWLKPTDACRRGVQNYDPSRPWAFDVYSLAMIYIEMLTDYEALFWANNIKALWCHHLEATWCSEEELPEDVPRWTNEKFDKERCEAERKGFCSEDPELQNKAYDAEHRVVHHDVLNRVVSFQEFFVEGVGGFLEAWHPGDVYTEFYKMVMSDQNASSFFKLMLDALKSEPSERPTVQNMLDDPWMKTVELDLFDIEKAEVAEDVMRQVLEIQKSITETSQENNDAEETGTDI